MIMKKINIRPIIVVASALQVLFLFVPIFPVRSGWGIESKSIINLVFGVTPSVAGNLFMIGRGQSIFTVICVIATFLMCFENRTTIMNSVPFHVVAQVICLGCWVVLTAESYLNTTGLSKMLRSSVGLIGSYEVSLFWPKVVILLNILIIAAFIMLRSPRFDIEELSLDKLSDGLRIYMGERESRWICKNCVTANDASNVFCSHCGTKRDDVSTSFDNNTGKTWICEKCGKENPGDDLFCTSCGTRKNTI